MPIFYAMGALTHWRIAMRVRGMSCAKPFSSR
jgi:hypothetical protein